MEMEGLWLLVCLPVRRPLPCEALLSPTLPEAVLLLPPHLPLITPLDSAQKTCCRAGAAALSSLGTCPSDGTLSFRVSLAFSFSRPLPLVTRGEGA